MRNRLLTSAAVLAFSAGAAFASDLPTHKAPPPPPPPPVFSWTGFYVGINGGYADPTSSISVIPGGSWIGDVDVAGVTAAGTDSFGLQGFTGGAQAGYNYQIGNMLVVGVEGDANYLGLHNSYATPVFAGKVAGTYWANGATDVDSLFTLRARVGLPVDHWLFYVTGGLAVTGEKFSQSINYLNYTTYVTLPATGAAGGANAGSVSSTVATWTLGGGVEYAFDNHWSVKGEYLYADLKSLGFSSSYTSPVSSEVYTMQHHDSLSGLNVFRIGLNYRM
jgi:outer membrane immunogenic protein